VPRPMLRPPLPSAATTVTFTPRSTKAIWELSGDHVGYSPRASGRCPLPSAFIRQMPPKLSRELRKRIVRPSGETTGALS
jgi:hypothetical protein